MKQNWNFLGGMGVQNKKPVALPQVFCKFVELHIICKITIDITNKIKYSYSPD